MVGAMAAVKCFTGLELLNVRNVGRSRGLGMALQLMLGGWCGPAFWIEFSFN